MQEVFLNYYKEESQKLKKYIYKFNKKLSEEKNPFIKENLEVFANLNSDGKLIRGTLVNLGYKIMKGTSDYSYPLALAFELFQTAILIHDDIIDRDELRRGKTTIHAYNAQKYYKATSSKKSLDFGNNIAICMGDWGLYQANLTISKNYKDEALLGTILNKFNDVALKTVKGEMIDVILPFHEEFNLENANLEENILEVYKLKTAYYTITGPLSLGLLLGGIEQEKLSDIEEFGYNVGVAFQLQDDLLGIYGDNIGKVIGSDIEEFKTTMLYAYTKKDLPLYEELMKYYGKEANDINVLKVREIFEKSGAKAFTENYITELYENAENKLKSITWINEKDKNILYGFIEYLKSRKK